MRMRPDDPRLRLVAALVLIGCLSQLHMPTVAGAALALVIIWSVASGAFRHFWHRLLHVEGFMLLLFLTLPFTVSGTPILSLGPLTASLDGIWMAVLIACKVSASVLVLMALLGDMEPSRFGAALRGCHVPERLSRLLVMTARYVSLIRDEARRLQESMRARGFQPGSNRHSWRSYGNLIGMLLVRALERAERVEEAMLSRGYHGHFPYRTFGRPSVQDWAVFILIAASGMAALLVDRL
ncbi:MAG: cobalt ECF transporter T component CbiQ [Xanthobacter sp.]